MDYRFCLSIMATAPFPNTYACRLVAASNSKACSICYKPTATVLVSQNNVDFLYVCESHLKDRGFAEPIHPDEYTALTKEKESLQAEIASTNKRAAACKPYSWNKMMNTIGWDSSAADKDVESGKETPAGEDQPKAKSYDDLIKISKELAKKLAQVDESIASFKFKNYRLDMNVYRNRLNGYLQAQNRLKRQKEMQTPGFFPLAPSHELA